MARKKANGNTMPVSMQAEVDKAIAELSDKIGSAGGDTLSVDGKLFTFPDGHQEEAPFGFVIINWISANLWWKGRYDKNNPTPPDCFAFNSNPKALIPSKNGTDIQCDETCADCPENVFGSGEGNAKACKNTRLLGIVAGTSDDVEDPILKLSASPTSIRNFDAYVQTLASKNLLPIQVITQIDFDANQTYPRLMFKAVGPNPNVELHWGRRPECEQMLLVEPDPTAFGDTATKSSGSRKTSKKTSKKTAKKAGGRSAGNRRV